uniref:Apple domain-containing protein n=1 Tax=Panagrellus redivivus TaxID=6233 RepID=A0A7E4UY46_PANRE
MKCGVFIASLSGFAVLCFGKVTFLHLNGVELVADTLSDYTTTDAYDCLRKCGMNSSCIAVQMATDVGICNLLTMVRNARNAMACDFFIKKERTVNIPGRSLTPLQQILQNAVYATQEACPEGWTDDGKTCTLAILQAECKNYAAFLGVTWDGTRCAIPRMNVTYSCPNSELTLKGFSNGYFCYAMILRGQLNGTIATMNDFCYNETGCYLASIHSEAENEFIASLRNSSLSNNAVIIGLESINGQVENATDFQWLDRTVLDYANFDDIGPLAEGMYTFPYPIMSMSNKWLAYFDVSALKFSMLSTSMICKCNANAEYSTTT